MLAQPRADHRHETVVDGEGRTDVAARAEAIQDALFSEHRDQATVAAVGG